MNRLRDSGFRRTVRLAGSKSTLYRRQFSKYGINVRNISRPADLGDFYLNSDELKHRPDELLCGTPELAVESSGTKGHATRVYLSRREMDYNARKGVVLKALYGISAEDRILSTSDYGFCLDGLLSHNAIPYWKSFAMCVGRVDPEDIYRRLADYRFNIVVSGIPWLARFTEVAEAEGRPYPLKLLIGGGGGGISPKTRRWIEDFWEAPLYTTYASAEAATSLGFECLQRSGYHFNEFDFYVEILNPDTEGYGEIVLTTLRRSVMPLIRYRTGDVARMIDEPCCCGLPFRRLSPLRGRLDEIVASVWGNVHPEFFDRLLDSVPGLTDEWQVALYEKDRKQTFQFRLELRSDAPRREEIQRRILEAIEKEHKLAWDAYTQKLGDVEFVFHPRGSLRKGRKLLRLVDERHSAEHR